MLSDYLAADNFGNPGNITAKKETAHNDQFPLLPQCIQLYRSPNSGFFWKENIIVTLSHLQKHFDTPSADDFWKYCGKRKICLSWSVSFCATMFPTYSLIILFLGQDVFCWILLVYLFTLDTFALLLSAMAVAPGITSLTSSPTTDKLFSTLFSGLKSMSMQVYKGLQCSLL